MYLCTYIYMYVCMNVLNRYVCMGSDRGGEVDHDGLAAGGRDGRGECRPVRPGGNQNPRRERI